VSGFFGSDLAGVAGTTLAALVTIAVWSYLAGERRVFGWAQHLLAGLSTGYLVIISVREVLVPSLVRPLIDAPAADPVLWPALLLVMALVLARWLPRQVVAIPVALLIAGTAAFALGGAVVGTLLPQLAASLLPGGATSSGLLNATIGLVITALVLIAFLHGTRSGRLGSAAAGSGRWLLVGGLGGWIGFLLVSRLALLVERLRFILVDWLGLGR
jgi:hypothetical protein